MLLPLLSIFPLEMRRSVDYRGRCQADACLKATENRIYNFRLNM